MKPVSKVMLLVAVGISVRGVSRADPAVGAGATGDVPQYEVVWYSAQNSGGRLSQSDVLVVEGTVGQLAGTASSSLLSLLSGYWTEDDVMLQPVGVGDPDAEQGPVGAFALSSVSPNPSLGHARIAWTLPNASEVRLTIHDVQGRQVALLADEVQGAGRHHLDWYAGSMGNAPPGLYFVRLKTEGGVFTKRLLVMSR